jgi:hypothetical protein
MNRIFAFLIVASIILTVSVKAQEQNTRFIKQHLSQTESSLIEALNNSASPSVRANAAQTIRELEWMFPDETFTTLISPLIRNVKDEQMDTQVRLLAAIALDALHSDDGDAAIASVAGSSVNQSMKDLCSALVLRSQRTLIEFPMTNGK